MSFPAQAAIKKKKKKLLLVILLQILAHEHDFHVSLVFCSLNVIFSKKYIIEIVAKYMY
jgi:hypothetical protein